MITIHIAQSSSEELPLESLALEEPSQYLMVREQVYNALLHKRDLDVFILTTVCDDWFWDLSDYCQDVILVNDSPIERLKRKLSVTSLPADISINSELIIDLKLLELPDPMESVVDVWNWILLNKLGELWTIEKPNQIHFSQLVNWYIENNVPSSLQHKVDEISKLWIQRAAAKLKSAYAILFENPNKNAYVLNVARALQVYDQNLREQWLANQGWYSPKLEGVIESVEMPAYIPQTIRKKINPMLQTHWTTRLKGKIA